MPNRTPTKIARARVYYSTMLRAISHSAIILACLLPVACGTAPRSATATPVAVTAALVATAAPSITAKAVTDAPFAFESVVAGGTTIEFAVSVPDAFDPQKAYPVLLALPPGGQDKTLTGQVMTEVWVGEARKRGWVVISPVAPGGVLFFEGAEELIPEFLRMVRVRYQPQGGRYMLAGISNGGISAFRVAGRNPELFYSLTALPGFPISTDDEAALGKLVAMPVTMFVGELDSSWVKAARQTATTLNQLNGRVTLSVLPNESHVLRSLSSTVLFDAIAQR